MVERKAIWLEVQTGRRTCLAAFRARSIVTKVMRAMVRYETHLNLFLFFGPKVASAFSKVHEFGHSPELGFYSSEEKCVGWA